MATSDTIAQIITMIEIAYEKNLGSEAQFLYHQLLHDIPDGLLKTATSQHIANSKWMPRISELREAAQSIQARALGLPTAAESWHEVKRQIANVGYYGHPEFGDKATATTVQAMGWKYLCTSKDEMADRAHYIRFFNQIQGRRQEERTSLPAVNEEITRLAEQMRQAKRLAKGDRNDANR